MMTLVSLDAAHDSMVPFEDARDYTTGLLGNKAHLQFGYDQHAINFEADMQALDTYDYEDFDLTDSTDDWLSIAVDMDADAKDFSEVSYVQLQPTTRKRKLQPKRQEKLKKSKVSKSKRTGASKSSFAASAVKPTKVVTKRKNSGPKSAKPDVSITMGAKLKNGAVESTPLKTLNSRSPVSRSEGARNAKKDKAKGRTAKTDENDKTISRSRVKSSMYRGVSRCAKDGRWQARIRHGSKVKYLGRFKTEYEAALCYDNAAKLFHGVRATTNF